MAKRSNLELSVTDFGPIARAEIDLRPLTVFVGPSNTGKSYLAILIYALHNFFSNHGAGRLRIRWSPVDEPDSLDARPMSDERIHSLIDWVEARLAQAEASECSDDLRVQVTELLRPLIQEYLEDVSEVADRLDEEVARCFGVENTGGLIRHRSRGGARVNLKRGALDSPDLMGSPEYRFTTKKTGADFAVSIPDETPLYAEVLDNTTSAILDRLRLDVIHARYELDERTDSDANRLYALYLLIKQSARLVEEGILSPLNRVAHYLPADRTGVMHAHRVAVGSLIARAPYAGLQRDDPLPLLSGVLADFLRQLSELGEPQGRFMPRSARPQRGRRDSGDILAERLEDEVLRGSVHNRITVTGYPVFSFRPEGWQDDLPLMNASSMVSELAPVVLYLRHVVAPGEVLIIEEPESHLHPAMQVEFIRHLAAAVRSGVRVMITTHSEWVLDELANLVRLSELQETRRQGIGGADYALSPDQLGVWLFEPKRRPRGSVVKEIPFDEEFGGFRSGFDEVAIGTYNDYAAISNRVEHSKAE